MRICKWIRRRSCAQCFLSFFGLSSITKCTACCTFNRCHLFQLLLTSDLASHEISLTPPSFHPLIPPASLPSSVIKFANIVFVPLLSVMIPFWLYFPYNKKQRKKNKKSHFLRNQKICILDVCACVCLYNSPYHFLPSFLPSFLLSFLSSFLPDAFSSRNTDFIPPLSFHSI